MKLREWQEAAFPLWWERKRGIVKVVTGGGKTVFAIHCLKKYLEENSNNSIFIVVPSIALLDQWYEGLQLSFKNNEIALNGGGERLNKLSKITISTIDSVKNIIENFDASKTLLIVDECHKIGTEKRGETLTNHWHATLGLSATPERDYDDNFYIIIRKILGDIIFDYDYIDAREDEVIVNFKLLYAYAAMTNSEEAEYKKFTKSIQRRAATIGGNNMNDYPLKMLIFNRARMVKNSINRIPFGIELLQKYKRDSWIVFTENKKQAKEFNTIINSKGYKSAIYNTDLDTSEREENLNNFKNGNLNVLVSCTALDEGFDMPEADGAMILSASSSKRQRIQRMGRVLRITANKQNALIVTVYSSKTEYEKLREESNRYQLEGVPVKWQQMK
ncbi:DEAD/DEAH box helicase [Gammaproteobacteria bacterium]|nr:DEAD/DEAH box helicase [Gammaproteobacteria bacterium]MDA7786440.1 DEAD/DEAH box helicase [Gammaproteobacteria bacterium]MDA8696638.1 DEAD/DEAH box helicase [Gammaproteobacteria bacterium]MDA8856580.1 DEAD/DEAH box helicase [Gammaproteobacteria bacterium]MDA8957519.1 DEAD/DEAH box helicase [Gammaproteobacteria bacterium]